MDFVVVIVYIGLLAASLAITYLIIKAAIRHALLDHYKTVRWYERTGEWLVGPFSSKDAPRAFEDGRSREA